MSLFKCFIIPFVSLLMLASCGGDDKCTAEAWVGTWTGTLSCDDGTDEPLTLIITMKDENTITLNDGDDTYDIAVNGCNIMHTESESSFLGDVMVDIQANVDGNKMSYDISAELLGIAISCDANLTK